MLRAREIIRQARRTIDRIPINGELVAKPEDVSESPSRTISDDAFLGWIAAEERSIVNDCKAQHVAGAVEVGSIDGLEGFVTRVMSGRVKRKDTDGQWRVARRRTLSEHRDLESSMRAATPFHPAFVYDDGRFDVYPPGGSPEAAVVISPERISLPEYQAGQDELTISEKFAASVLYGTCAQAEQMLANETPARLEFASNYRQLSDFFLRPFLRTHRFGRYADYQRGKIDNREVSISA